jgi:hypothetical protein
MSLLVLLRLLVATRIVGNLGIIVESLIYLASFCEMMPMDTEYAVVLIGIQPLESTLPIW